jgi:exonuclease SbcC
MKPLKLELENFGPFAGKASIDFTALGDIFLVTGKTGAGKTTIFDAICFALYGKVPGGRNEHLQKLKSDFGSPYSGECSVKLEFMIGERHFRVERSPKQEKPKKRGTGGVVIEESTTLFERKKGEWESVNVRKSEADEKIKKIIGFDAKEFFKIVLLPQGEFAKFLRQNSTERKDVLGKLFPVDDATRIREIVAEKAKDAADQIRQISLSIEEVVKRLSSGDLDDIRVGYAEKLARLKTEIEQSSENYAILKKKSEQRQEEKQLKERLSAIELELLSLNNKESAIKEKENALVLSRKAQPLMQFVVLEEVARQDFNLRYEEWETAHENAVFARKKAEELELRTEEIATFEKESRALREKLPLLREMRDAEKVISEKRNEIATEEKQASSFVTQRSVLEQRITEKEEEIQILLASSSQIESLDTQFEDERAQKDNLVKLKEIVHTRETVQSAVPDMEKCLKELEKDISARENELKRLEMEKMAFENANRAAYLAVVLKKGEPCPVCGSLEHPHPAAAAERIFGIDERIEVQQRYLNDMKQDWEGKKQEVDSIQKQISALFKSAMDLGFFKYGETDGVEFEKFKRAGKEDVDKRLADKIDKLNAVTDKRQSARQAGVKLPSSYDKKSKFQKQMADIEKQQALSNEKQRSLANEVRAMEQRIAMNTDANTSLPRGANRVETALADAEARLDSVEKTLKDFHEEREKAQNALSAATARENSALDSKELATSRLYKEVSSLQKAFNSSSFTSAGEVKAVVLDLGKSSEFEQEIAQWKQNKTQALSLKEELENRLADFQTGEAVDDTEITIELERIAAEKKNLEIERDNTQVDRASFERDSALLREKEVQQAKLNKENEILSCLKEDIEGKNSKRCSFEAWLLGKYLAEIASFASKRLQKMSEGRYSLLIDCDRAGGRAFSGLDLQVFDAYTGKARPCATLSGGESFLASISLALGLADSVQSRSGGIRLDAVFIDEGFGSLDETSLDKAMSILDELRDSRMVGLISHVESLRSRIPSRIEVIKGAEGSRVMSFN